MNKSRSFRMTDEQHAIIVGAAKARGLTVGKFLVELCEGQSQTQGIPYEVMCRLSSIYNLLTLPAECWNNEMISLYEENFKKLCVLLKW